MPLSRRRFTQLSSLVVASGLLPQAAMAKPNARNFEEYRSYDALGLTELVSTGQASPMELLDLAIARTEAVNPAINAVVIKHYELAREQVRQGVPAGPFQGVPFLLKDLGIALKGTVTTEGSRFFSKQRLDYDSTLVERYRRAGLTIFGKTHSPEFGSAPSSESALFGKTHNPWNLAHSAGGSSGGSAAAVAAGIIPAAHASDGGGSIRIPASACGLLGLKPTRGRVPMGPANYETRDGLSAMHVVSRSVRDCAALLDISQGAAPGDAYAAPARHRPFLEAMSAKPGKLRIALMREPLLPLPVDSACRDAVDAAARLCESLGHRVSEDQPTLDAMELWQTLGQVSNVLVAGKIAAREQQLGRSAGKNDIEPANLRSLADGRKIDAVSHSRARGILHKASRQLDAFMVNYDLILSPTLALVPPRLGVLALDQPAEAFMLEAGRASAFTSLYNMTGQPAISVPLHWSADELPVGVMFAGRFGDEALLLQLAAQLEEAQPWFHRVPQLTI
ncbi:MAG: amidase [Halioglobus sp.]